MAALDREGGAGTVPLAALKAYLRIENSEEDALLAGLLRGAASLCEQFVGQWLIERAAEEVIPASAAWTRLSARPVRAVDAVSAMPCAGEEVMLGADAFAVDLDGNGDGWVRVRNAGGAPRVRVRYRAGMAGEMNALPEAIRQGIVRLAAEQHVRRDGPARVPPAAVTALWRPWRRMRLI